MDSIAFSTNQYPKQSSDFFCPFFSSQYNGKKNCDFRNRKEPAKTTPTTTRIPTHVLATTLARAQLKVASFFFFTFERRRRRRQKKKPQSLL